MITKNGNFELIDRICSKQMKDKFFSGAQIVFVKNGQLLYQKNAGTIHFDSLIHVTTDTRFDLASLTKPLCTLPIFAWLVHHHHIQINQPVTDFIPEINQQISLKALLAHSSGYPAYESFYLKLQDKGELYDERKTAIIDHIAQLKNNFPPIYSDINYILLGFVLEQIYQKRLNDIFSEFVHEIGYSQQNPPVFKPQEIDNHRIVATGYSLIRKKICHGTVEDENAYFLEGIAGHAGLFGSATSVAYYLSYLLNQEWFMPFILEGIGFDKPTLSEYSAYGKYPKPYYRGHLGYTGTAFLINSDHQEIAVIFTNRTHPTDTKPRAKERIRSVRQRIFDLLLES